MTETRPPTSTERIPLPLREGRGEGCKESRAASPHSPLKLRAQDTEDVSVIAAILQDSIAPVCDMLYDPAAKNFVMIVHRFRWDESEKKSGTYERVHCAFDIAGVESVQHQGFTPFETSRMLDLLTMTLTGNELRLIFAGEAQLKLTLDAWCLHLRDFGEPWPTPHQPSHAT